jgi:hypothetical protein
VCPFWARPASGRATSRWVAMSGGPTCQRLGSQLWFPKRSAPTGRDHEMVARVYCDLHDIRAAGIPGCEVQQFNERRRGDDAPPSTAIRPTLWGWRGLVATWINDGTLRADQRSCGKLLGSRAAAARRTATRRGSGLWVANPEPELVRLWPPATRPLCDLGGGGRCVELGVHLCGPGVEDRVDRRPREGGASDAQVDEAV